ncbi:MAG: hypothetical protein AAGD34_00865 [Pseudomonadota bacterium]
MTSDDPEIRKLSKRVSALEDALADILMKLTAIEEKGVAALPSGNRGALAPSQHPLKTETIMVGAKFVNAAFYTLEKRGEDGLPFRWMGRASTADMRVKIGRDKALSVEVYVAVHVEAAVLESFTVSCDGDRALLTDTTPAAGNMVVKRFRFAPLPKAPRLPVTTLELSLGKVTKMNKEEDRRILGVGIHKIVVSEIA